MKIMIEFKDPSYTDQFSWIVCPFMEEDYETNYPYCYLTGVECVGHEDEGCPIISIEFKKNLWITEKTKKQC